MLQYLNYVKAPCNQIRDLNVDNYFSFSHPIYIRSFPSDISTTLPTSFGMLSHLDHFSFFQNRWFVQNQFTYFPLPCITVKQAKAQTLGSTYAFTSLPHACWLLCIVGQHAVNNNKRWLVNWVQQGGEMSHMHLGTFPRCWTPHAKTVKWW